MAGLNIQQNGIQQTNGENTWQRVVVKISLLVSLLLIPAMAQASSMINSGLNYNRDSQVEAFQQVKSVMFSPENIYYKQGMAASFGNYRLVNVKVGDVADSETTFGYMITTEIGTAVMNFVSLSVFGQIGKEDAKSDRYMHFNNFNFGAKLDFFLHNPLANVIITGAALSSVLGFEVHRNFQRLYGVGGLLGLSLQRSISQRTSVTFSYEYIQTNLTGTMGRRSVVDSIFAESEHIGLGLILLF